MNFAYIRVSTKEQHIERQKEELLKYVDSERYIYIDKITGTKNDRPALNALKMALRNGDHIYIHELDRLGRNKEIIANELKYFKDEGIYVHFLDIPTTLVSFENYGKLERSIIELINSVLIEVLSVQAEQEYIKIKKRQQEGILQAKLKNKHLGRPRIPLPDNFSSLYQDWKSGRLRTVDFQKKLNVKPSSFYNIIKRYESK